METPPWDEATPPWEEATTTVRVMREEVAAFNAERDWARYHSPRNLAMALTVEAGELLELFLWSSDEGPQPPVESRLPRVAEEAADVMICLLNLCDRSGIDLAAAVQAKLARNAERYPVQLARGRLEKSTELAAAQPDEGEGR